MRFSATVFFAIISIFINSVAAAQQSKLLRTYSVKEVKQAVAVDEKFFYTINNSTIYKYDKASGVLISEWDGAPLGIKHLNSGVVIKGKLYCANSNYPTIPMSSSVEIFDVRGMKHIGSHSFGIAPHGSLTWVDQRDGLWYAGFANYAGKEASEGRDVRWTSIVKYNKDWLEAESWIFPDNLVALFTPKSNSGGVWSVDGKIYCTGHDRAEVYVLKIPASGYMLEHIKTIPVDIQGQGISIDKSVKNKTIIYGFRRSDNTVTVSEIVP